MSQTVSQAVAQRPAAQLTKHQAAQRTLKHALDHYRPVVARLLDGTGINQETFTAQIGNACRVTPKLLECSTETLLGSALRCAQLGLAPNDVRNLAWIIPYGKEATFQLGYGGVLELARRAMPGLRFDGRPVYPNDEFDLDYGRAQPLTHRPAVVRGLDHGGDAFAWYVRAIYPDDGVQIHLLDREGVEHHRSFSKQPNGEMWSKSYDAAALKSVVLDMRRWLPSSAQLVSALDSDERAIDVREIEDEPTPVDLGEITHEPEVEA